MPPPLNPDYRVLCVETEDNGVAGTEWRVERLSRTILTFCLGFRVSDFTVICGFFMIFLIYCNFHKIELFLVVHSAQAATEEERTLPHTAGTRRVFDKNASSRVQGRERKQKYRTCDQSS